MLKRFYFLSLLLILTVSNTFSQNCGGLVIDKFCCSRFTVLIETNLSSSCFVLQVDGVTYDELPEYFDLLPGQSRSVCLFLFGEMIGGGICCDTICETVTYDHEPLVEDFNYNLCLDSPVMLDICMDLLYDVPLIPFGIIQFTHASTGDPFYTSNSCDVIILNQPMVLNYTYTDPCGCVMKQGTITVTKYLATTQHTETVSVKENCCILLGNDAVHCPEQSNEHHEWFVNGISVSAGSNQFCYCPQDSDVVELKLTADPCDACELRFEFDVSGTFDSSPKDYNFIQSCSSTNYGQIVDSLVQCETCGAIKPFKEYFYIDQSRTGPFTQEVFNWWPIPAVIGEYCNPVPDPYYVKYIGEDCAGNITCEAYILITFVCCD